MIAPAPRIHALQARIVVRLAQASAYTDRVLSPYRVIDMTDESGILCGQILGDLGADVIFVEPRGGSSARNVGPRTNGESDADLSLYFAAYARGKRSIALDVEDPADREVLLRLIDGADFFIESARPGQLAALGLDYTTLAARNPGLVHVSITPFGQTGPKAHYHGTDLTQMAAGGHLFLSGDADGTPVRVSVPQAHAHAGADAAVGALIAHYARRQSGLGQHVDISAQQSVTLATMFRSLDTPMEQPPAIRMSGGVLIAGHFVSARYPLTDGWVVLGPAILPSTGHFMKRVLVWAAEEGLCDASYAEQEWGTFALRIIQREVGAEGIAELDAVLKAFFGSRSKAELMKGVVERKLLAAPLLELDEMVDSAQLASRGFPIALEGFLPGRPRYPGPFAKFGAKPIRYTRPAPQCDESGDALRAEAPRAPAPTGNAPDPALPLEGVKILDLFWVLAGPGSTRMLADYGAEVVHVESTRHVDTLRVIPPYQFGHPHPEGAGGYQSANANKHHITIDVGAKEGIGLLHELIAWADVVTESFAPGVMDAAGLDYETIRKINPKVIMISSCLMGQTGPWREFSGFGNLAAGVCGFQVHASWPDTPPPGPHGAYTDFIAVRYNAIAILAALEHRDRTGEGQYIDQSQAEAGMHFLAPAFLDWTLNGRLRSAQGNSDPDLSPHGVYPAEGEDRWVAIVAQDEAAWRALCEVIGAPDLVAERGDTARVDAAITAYTRARPAEESEARLQAAGVAAHVLLDTPGLFTCPQLQHRGHYLEVEHEIYQTMAVESTRLRLSRHAARVPQKARSLGCDNRFVLEEILGRSPEEIAALAERGALL